MALADGAGERASTRAFIVVMQFRLLANGAFFQHPVPRIRNQYTLLVRTYQNVRTQNVLASSLAAHYNCLRGVETQETQGN